ncbi:MAG: three-Cys-motif partner protein TcmP [Rhodoplanes sp.]
MQVRISVLKYFLDCSIFVLFRIRMAQRTFGGPHTSAKLDKLERYLHAFTTALKKQPFRLIYFDAFAGTGDIPQGDVGASIFDADDYRPLIAGSADRALRISTPFDEYVLVEKSRDKADKLEELRSRFPALADRTTIICGDANAELRRFCRCRNWQECRAIVFLDPFGNQVAWETIVAIAQTEAIDLWYLFPAGLGVHRQIGRDGTVDDTHTASLDRLFGAPDWREAFIEERFEPDLFAQGRSVSTKSATPESITRFMIARMKEVFRAGVLDEWLPLGSRNIHMYSLLFAWANPSPKAAALATRLAAAVLRSTTRGRRK